MRGLDRTLFLKLASCDWITEHRNLLITVPCGVGKSWLACALGQKACRENRSVLYQRIPRMFAALALARGDGRYAKLLHQLARVELLILDDWGPEPLSSEQRRDLLEIVEDRYDAGSLMVMIAMLFMAEERVAQKDSVPLLSCADIIALLKHFLPQAAVTKEDVVDQMRIRHDQRLASIKSAYRVQQRRRE